MRGQASFAGSPKTLQHVVVWLTAHSRAGRIEELWCVVQLVELVLVQSWLSCIGGQLCAVARDACQCSEMGRAVMRLPSLGVLVQH